MLTIEHRAAIAPRPVTLSLAGEGSDEPTYLILIRADSDHPGEATDNPGGLDATILAALDRAPDGALERTVPHQ